MAESLQIAKGTRPEQYQTLIPQIKALIAGEADLVANTANIAAALKQTFGFLWLDFIL
jgi:L-methionine (R)-S-oxide reductase